MQKSPRSEQAAQVAFLDFVYLHYEGQREK